jgi:hypothetical protein
MYGVEMADTLIETRQLDNGLTLELYDRTRHIAGDRCQVRFTAEVEVEVRPEYFDGQNPKAPTYDQAKAVLGDRVRYAYEGTRNFIPEARAQAVLAELKDYFLNNNVVYVSAPDFAPRLVLRKYQQTRNPTLAWRKI